MARENVFPVPELIVPRHVLLSVYDKSGLKELVNGIIDNINPDVMFYSTGGTGRTVVAALGDRAASHYTPVEEFTGYPEMDGGLVKTLHPKIHAGLLAERNNSEHMRYLETIIQGRNGGPGVYFDLMVGNFYPFKETIEKTIKKTEITSESARADIDIGGPTMIGAAAKNWHSVAVLTHPGQYPAFLQKVITQKGITAEQRFSLAVVAMKTIAKDRTAIHEYFSTLDFEKDVRPHLNWEE